MRFYADLHVHSKYSRATSSDCDLAHLSYWAQRKGIAVLGTGDFTHPVWMAELRESLVPAEPGLFRLRDDLDRAVADRLPGACRGVIRFVLSVEISTIYKKGDRTRKIHHLLYAPDFEAADRIVRALSRVGNLSADGRPILGLDSRHLLEIVLESGEGSYLVPAHIWTPWFSVLGSKAGFDAVEECYGDLAPHIFALETGLSSDPAMNWRISGLDRYRLVSSSDAHSPAKLGREATAFDTSLDYFAIRRALETGQGFSGTVEFFPEEGKYHLDGHRKCNVVLSPAEARARSLLCPVCSHPVTVGVLHRVEELADRDEGARPEGASEFRNLVPLPEVLAELHGVGASSKAVQRSYDAVLSRLGPELFLLGEAPLDDIERAGTPLLSEAIARMREGRVIRDAGYDGEYGVIRVFEPDELKRRHGGGLLFQPDPAPPQPPPAPHPPAAPRPPARRGRDRAGTPPAEGEAGAPPRRAEPAPASPGGPSLLDALDPEQRAAAEIDEGALLLLAGPGTGKTRTLTHRIAHLVVDLGVPPEQCLAITFTRRAADELRERLGALLGEAGGRVPAMTFHALGLSLLREHAGGGAPPKIAGEHERTALLAGALGIPERRAARLLAEIAALKRSCPRHADTHRLPEGALPAGGDVDRAWKTYEDELAARGLLDLDDLIGHAVLLLEERSDVLAAARARARYLSIDEYQDIDERQYRLVRALVPPGGNVCAIGDPDQAIYGFRGADVGFFFRFQQDFPAARVVRLKRNYRSASPIVEAALQVIAPSPTLGARELVPNAPEVGEAERVVVHEAPTERAEAEQVVHAIERMIGGSTFFSMDSGRVASPLASGDHAFSDFAVLYRTEAQSEALREALARSGMPFQRRSERRVLERAASEALARALADTPPGPLVPRLKAAAARLREDVALPGPAAAPAAEGGAAEGAPGAARLGEADVDAALELCLPLAERCGADLDRFLIELAVCSEIDAWDPRADRISLLTLHAAKGLEFRVVFLVGCEDGLLPLRFPGRAEVDVAEERRLFYVGMTRARERLFLSRARERARHGKVVQTEVSPFVREVEERLLAREGPAPGAQKRSRADESRQLKLF
ncbi:ATPase AAA [Sorangium cellulosum]|uniref:DNA 3'-5' helicase n=1 Tax=Sorangium cellulosum TaxID=56 RepID=A0A2L0EU87_SORCE|nr:UvrD-helicase domain-containing protein [Sorangium cellulosum]AUX42845.1 ATPase AAA [Sorangium cellulosum]